MPQPRRMDNKDNFIEPEVNQVCGCAGIKNCVLSGERTRPRQPHRSALHQHFLAPANCCNSSGLHRTFHRANDILSFTSTDHHQIISRCPDHTAACACVRQQGHFCLIHHSTQHCRACRCICRCISWCSCGARLFSRLSRRIDLHAHVAASD